MTYIQEEWKPVVGFENAYEVSSQGRVRQIGIRSNASAVKLMKQNQFCKGIHLYVGLCPNGKGDQNNSKIQKKIPVHRLVAEAFLGPRPQGMVVNHKDGFGFNNWAENLEYTTPRGNAQHALLNNLRVHNLTPEKVRAIRSAPKEIRNSDLSRSLGVDNSQVSRVRRGLAWKFVK